MVGSSSDQNSFVHDTEEKRWLHDRTKEEHRKRLGVHRKTFRHRSPGHDLLWTGSNLQDSSFLVTARYRFRERCGRAFDVHVDHSERQRWQTTKLSTLTFPQILWNHVFIKPFIGRSTMTNPPRKRCKSKARLLPPSSRISALARSAVLSWSTASKFARQKKDTGIASSLRPEMKANSRE